MGDLKPIAVLFQATAAPEIEGVSKPMKPGGYSDSSADIAFNLRNGGYEVLFPCEDPDPNVDLEWCYPDTYDGIKEALNHGAECLWANTVLYADHPIRRDFRKRFAIVGQGLRCVDRFDNKFRTNELLRKSGLSVAASILVGPGGDPGVATSLDRSLIDVLIRAKLHFPLAVKPVRGRGSEGVAVVEDLAALLEHAMDLTSQGFEAGGRWRSRYGRLVIIEAFLPGEEVTITVTPPGVYKAGGRTWELQEYRSMPPVYRVGHVNGVAPYNGVVAVTKNSRPATINEMKDMKLKRLQFECQHAAALISALQPIRIDARRNRQGNFEIFDVNLKPNLTGPGRPGRDDQDGLMLMAARGLGWSFVELLANMARNAKQQAEII